MSPSDIPQVIIGTAGHIDHGKTALVKALTGIDADTLEEEKRRGITIELGFVFMPVEQTLWPARQIVFIDVPGHERLIRTMVAGAANLDAAMLVIAADAGVSAQTREHFDILRLLGLRHGLIALTKTDLVDEARLQAVTTEIRQFIADSFLADAPILPVSAITGAGLEDLRAALFALAARIEPRADTALFRMPIDRVFTMHGFGTVIAGTVLSGEVAIGDQITIYPEGFTARVRGVQVHGHKQPRSAVGRRTAINIPDLKKEDLRRGQTAAAPGSLQPTTRLDAQLFLLPAADELKHRSRVRLHTATDEVIARVTLLDRERLLPGDTATVQFALERPAVAVARDRFVVRTFSPLMTIGGGTILDANPERHRRFDEDTLAGLVQLEGDVKQVVAQNLLQSENPLSAQELMLDTGHSQETIAQALAELLDEGLAVRLSDTHFLHAHRYAAFRDRLLSTLQAYYAKHPQRLWMPLSELQSQLSKSIPKPITERLLRDLFEEGVLLRRESKLRPADRRIELPPDQQKLADAIEARYRQAGLAPPAEDEVREKLKAPAPVFASVMTALLEQERLVRVADRITYHADHLRSLKEKVAALIKAKGTLTVAQLRDEVGISRKYALAALEYFDETGFTRRQGDVRVLT